MITATDQGASRWHAIRAGYWRWERRWRGRISGWSVRRRWTILVLLPTLLICCGGTAVGVPAAWVLRETAEASRGAQTPDGAANEYLMALGYNDESGLVAVLDNRHQDELLAQWRAYRFAMDGTTPAPSRLDFGALNVGQVAEKRAVVTTNVSATWWNVDGPTGMYRSGQLTWRFETREDNGWQISAVESPAWCGGYVRADACKR